MSRFDELRGEFEKSRDKLSAFLKKEDFDLTVCFDLMEQAVATLNAGISFIDDIIDSEEDARFERNTRE